MKQFLTIAVLIVSLVSLSGCTAEGRAVRRAEAQQARDLEAAKKKPYLPANASFFCAQACQDGCRYMNRTLSWVNYVAVMGYDPRRYEIVNLLPINGGVSAKIFIKRRY